MEDNGRIEVSIQEDTQEEIKEEIKEQPKPKHAGGRPKGTTKRVMEARRKEQELLNSNAQMGNIFSIPEPDKRNLALEKSIPGQEERKELVSTVVGRTLLIYKQPKCETLQEAEERTEYYFMLCQQGGVLPTVEGLALCLGVTPAALHKWQEGIHHPERADLINRAKALIAEVDAQLVTQGKMPPVPYIFRAKNFYGMTDKNEVQVTATPFDKIDEHALKRSINETVIEVDLDDITDIL